MIIWLALGALGLLLAAKGRGTTAPVAEPIQTFVNSPADAPVVHRPQLYSPRRIRLDEVVRLTNEARARGVCGYPPAPPLAWNEALAAAAQGHAQDMAARNYFSHATPEGATPTARMRAKGFPGGYTGENIAAGQVTPNEVVQGWIDSPGHCRNLMAAEYSKIGIGHAAGGALKHYWVQNFGS